MNPFDFLPNGIINSGKAFLFKMPSLDKAGYYFDGVSLIAVTRLKHMTHNDLFMQLAYRLMKNGYIKTCDELISAWDARSDDIFDSVIADDERHG